MRAVAAVALFASAAAWAQPSMEGVGRAGLDVGWRFTPQSYFDGAAGRAGYPSGGASPGGPAAVASFGYGATDWLEIGIDLFASGEKLSFQGLGELTSVSYGALLGVRVQHLFTAGPFPDGWAPYLGLMAGPTLVDVSVPDSPLAETLTTGYAGAVGALIRLSDHWALDVEARVLLARGNVPQVGSAINGGGAWVMVGLSRLFARETQAIGVPISFAAPVR